MKKKISCMIMNATKTYPTGKENVNIDNNTKRTLQTIDWQRLTKKKRVPNQCPDHRGTSEGTLASIPIIGHRN